jgi:hypothetical protein
MPVEGGRAVRLPVLEAVLATGLGKDLLFTSLADELSSVTSFAISA